MSCRRKDRANLIGCNIGDVALRGCSQACCPYPDEQKFEHTHPHLLKGEFITSESTSLPQDPGSDTVATPTPMPTPSGRTNLRFRSCETPHRPKFICLSRSCRRLFKPFFDPLRFDYRVDRNGWSVRPRWDVCPELRAAARLNASLNNLPPETRRRMNELRRRFDDLVYQRQCHQQGHTQQEQEQEQAREEQDRSPSVSVSVRPSVSVSVGVSVSVSNSDEPLSDEDLAWLRKYDPEAWWTRLLGLGHDHAKRCPCCGGPGVRVGSNFRVPARKDEKGWKELERMVGQGVDMLAEFEFCPTVEMWEEMAGEAGRITRGREGMKEDET